MKGIQFVHVRPYYPEYGHIFYITIEKVGGNLDYVKQQRSTRLHSKAPNLLRRMSTRLLRGIPGRQQSTSDQLMENQLNESWGNLSPRIASVIQATV